jgi:AcrR family transcriptional regulator
VAAAPDSSNSRPKVRTLGRPPASDGAQTRQTILTAASRQLASIGYDGMTLESVANEAGITKAAIYRYFPSKRSLMLAAVRDAHPIYDEYYVELSRDAKGIADRLRALVKACIKFSLENPQSALGYFQSGRLADQDEEIARIFRARTAGVRKVIAGIISDAAAAGELVPGTDQREIVDAVCGVIWVMTAGVAEAQNQRVRRQIELATELFLHDPPWIVKPVVKRRSQPRDSSPG